MPSQQSNNKKLFNNPLISESNLSTGNYNPQVINNIDRVHPNSDRWFCNNCTFRDDKWGMMKHLCKHNKRKRNEKKEESKKCPYHHRQQILKLILNILN